MEQLQAGHDADDACAEVGRELARDGAALGEALDGLQATWALRGRGRARPPRDAGDVRGLGRGVARLPPPALLRGPADGPGQPCSSAGQGLGGLPGGRAGGDVAEPEPRARARRPPPARRPSGWDDPFEATLRLVQLAETARTVFPGEESIAKASPSRLVVLARRGNLLARRVGLLRDLVDAPEHDLGRARVWVEGLPPTTGGGDDPARRDRAQLGRRTSAGTGGLSAYVAGRPREGCARRLAATVRHVRPLRLEPAAGGPRRGVRDPRLPDAVTCPTSSPTSTSRRPRRSTPSSSARRGGRRRRARGRRSRERQLRVLTWGLVPFWAKDPKIGSRMINARMETVAEKPAYRRAFERRRAILPADGYFEWYATDAADQGRQAAQAALLHPSRRRRRARDGRALRDLARPRARPRTTRPRFLWTCTVLTTSAEDDLGHIHDRMPLMLDPGAVRRAGSTRAATTATTCSRLLEPAAPGRLEAFPVSTAGLQRHEQRARAGRADPALRRARGRWSLMPDRAHGRDTEGRRAGGHPARQAADRHAGAHPRRRRRDRRARPAPAGPHAARSRTSR